MEKHGGLQVVILEYILHHRINCKRKPILLRVGIKILPLLLEQQGRHIIHAVGVRPLLTSHSSDVIEVVARENLRELWDLEDGEIITIHLANVV